MSFSKVQSVFISDGTALPANDGAISAVTPGKIGVYGQDVTALNPAGGDTVTTQPYIYVVSCNTDTEGVNQLKRSGRIYHADVTSYKGASYTPAKREVWAIGHNRKTGVGTIAAANATAYKMSIVFKHDKQLGSERPMSFSINFVSAAAATQSTIADQIVAAITNNKALNKYVKAIKIGDGTGVYGLTAPTDYGVEITAKDIDQYTGTNYNNVKVYFSVHVDDDSGFGATTTCTQIQANEYGVGTYEQVRIMEDKAFAMEGVLNRTMWPIPVLDYAVSPTYALSAAIVPTVTGTVNGDTVTFTATVATMLRAGEKVELNGVNYEIKYFISTTVAVLTSEIAVAIPALSECKVRTLYDIITIEYNERRVTSGTNTVTLAPRSVIIAVPALDAGDAYNGVSAAGQDLMDILNPWMLGSPSAFANISI